MPFIRDLRIYFRSLFRELYLRFCKLILICVSYFQHKLKSTQKDKVKRFVSFTRTSEQLAIHCLSQHDWKLELASDAYFQNPDSYWRDIMGSKTISSSSSVDKKKIEQLFNKYRGKDKDKFLWIRS